jgi:hypothetical protein
MKTSAVVLAAVLAMGSTASHAQDSDHHYFSAPANYRSVDLEKAQNAYKCCLGTENPGVQESALAHLVWLKVQRPDADLSPLRECLDRLAVAGATTSVRYRAYLATLLLDSSSIFVGLENERFATDAELFSAMSGRLQKTLLGYSDRRYVRER